MLRLTGGHLRKHVIKKSHRHHHHNVYRHASLGPAALACCLNYSLVQLYARAAWFCVNKE